MNVMAVEFSHALSEKVVFGQIFDASRSYTLSEQAVAWLRKIDSNTNTAPYVLRRLANYADADLKTAVADHHNTPQAVLLMLAEDDNADIRYAMAENHNLSSKVLKKLCSDDNPYVADRALRTTLRMGIDEGNA